MKGNEKERKERTRQEEVRDAVQRRMMEGLNAALDQGYKFTRLTPSMGMGKTYTVARFMKEAHDRDKEMRFFYFAPNISTRNAMKKELMDAGACEDDILVVESEDDCLKKNSERLESILEPVLRMKASDNKYEAKIKETQKKLKDDLLIKKYKEAQDKVEKRKKELRENPTSSNLKDKVDAEKARDDARKDLLGSVKDIIRLSGGEKGMSGEDRKTLSGLLPKLLIKDRTYILATHKMIDFSASATGSDRFWQTFKKNDILIIDEADRIKETMWATQLDETEDPLDCYEMLRSISNKLNGDCEGDGKYSINSLYGENAGEICNEMKCVADECLSWLNGGRPAANRRLEDEALSTLNIATFGKSTKVAGDGLYVKRKDDRLSITREKTEISIRDMERRLTAKTRRLLYCIRKLSTALYENRREIDVTYTYENAIENTLTDVGLSDKTTREAVKNNIYKYGVKKKGDKKLPMDDDDQYRTGCAVTLVSDRNRSVTSSSFRTFMFTSTPNYRIRCAVENARMTVFVSSTVMGRSVRNLDFGYLSRIFAWTGRSEYAIRYDGIVPYIDEGCTVKEIDVQDKKKVKERIELMKNPNEEARKMRNRLKLWMDKDHDKNQHRFFLIGLISFIDAMMENGNKAGLFFTPAFPKEKEEKDKDPWWNKEIIERIISTYGDGIECKAVKAEDLRERGREFKMNKDMLVVITTGQSAGVGENLTVMGRSGEQCDFDAVFVNKDSHVEAVIDWESASDKEKTEQKKKVIAQWSDLAVLENLRRDCLAYAANRISGPTRQAKPTDSDLWDENPLFVQQAANAVQKIGRITRRVAGSGKKPVRKLVCYDSRLRTECHVSALMFPDTEFMGCAGAFFEYVEKKENEGMPKEVAEAIDRIEEKNIKESDRFMKSLGRAREGGDATEYDCIRSKCWSLLDASETGFCRAEYKRLLFSTDGLRSLCFTQRGGWYTLRENHGTPLVQEGVPAAREAFNMDAMNSAYGAATGLYLTDRRLAGDGSMLLPKYVEVAKGEIGERYFLELCRKNGIDLVPLPSDLKEEADFMVRGTDIYIDVKNHRQLTLDPHAVEKKISGILVIANIFPMDDDGEIFTPPAPIDGRDDLTMCIIHRFGSPNKRTEKKIEEAIGVLKSVIISRSGKGKEEE